MHVFMCFVYPDAVLFIYLFFFSIHLIFFIMCILYSDVQEITYKNKEKVKKRFIKQGDRQSVSNNIVVNFFELLDSSWMKFLYFTAF